MELPRLSCSRQYGLDFTVRNIDSCELEKRERGLTVKSEIAAHFFTYRELKRGQSVNDKLAQRGLALVAPCPALRKFLYFNIVSGFVFKRRIFKRRQQYRKL